MAYETLFEPARQVPVCADVDLCVVGGSCTGVFAAVRAARLGLRVAVIEKQNALGGVATSGLVNVWHTLYDTDWNEQVIAGLTAETLERLDRRGVLLRRRNPNSANVFNSQNLKIELDDYIREHKIQLYLHSFYAGLQTDGRRVTAVFMEGKDGRRAIRASFFIDATGDGDLARDLGVASYRSDAVQPPTACFLLQGRVDGLDLQQLFTKHGAEFGMAADWGWSVEVPGLDNITMRADNHVYGLQCDRADDLTKAEMEGRKFMRGFVELMRKYGHPGENYALVSACSNIGVRDTVHYITRYRVCEDDLLLGRRFDDAVLNGTYRVDVHHAHDDGITFKNLDGSTETIYGKDERIVRGDWRKERGLTKPAAKYYQAPFSMLVGETHDNFLCVGRMLNADQGAFGALRVMVNLNQLGEAAGVAAYLAVQESAPIQSVSGIRVRKLLKAGGSAL